MLDNFVAHKLSLLTECGAGELPPDESWLNDFILNNAFRVNLPAKTRAFVFNFLRRAEAARWTYRGARTALIEYLPTPSNVISPYFRALLGFEICISQCYQGYELLMKATGEKIFTAGDGSDAERLRNLYIHCKHMDLKIKGGKMPTGATATIWITNQGLESDEAALSFDELLEVLSEMGRIAEQVSKIERTN